MISGQPGQIASLRGPLPRSLARAGLLKDLTASWHTLEGVIPQFAAATLRLLSLQSNKLKLMSEAEFENKSKVFVHNNLLSCHLPLCGNTTVKLSLSGLGNQLSSPRTKPEIPVWLSPNDRDKLFWVTGCIASESCIMMTERARQISWLIFISTTTHLSYNTPLCPSFSSFGVYVFWFFSPEQTVQNNGRSCVGAVILLQNAQKCLRLLETI